MVGEREVIEWTSFHGCMGAVCNLSELIQGRRYFFRACAGNIKGWGPYKLSTPNCVVPSSEYLPVGIHLGGPPLQIAISIMDLIIHCA